MDIEYILSVLSGLGNLFLIFALILLYPLIAKVRMMRRSHVTSVNSRWRTYFPWPHTIPTKLVTGDEGSAIQLSFSVQA